MVLEVTLATAQATGQRLPTFLIEMDKTLFRTDSVESVEDTLSLVCGQPLPCCPCLPASLADTGLGYRAVDVFDSAISAGTVGPGHFPSRR